MLYLSQNQALIENFNMQEAKGASLDKLKKIQMEIACSYGINLDTKIYRVLKAEHLIDDLENNMFTLPQISTNTWGNSSGENPLSKMEYFLEDGTKFSINLNDYFGSCWSTSADAEASFREFGSGLDTIRIESTVEKILEELMNIGDVFYTLHYHVGPITYKNESEIRNWFKQTPYDAHLDSSGTGLAQSLLLLADKFEEEEEVRFVYLYQPQQDNQWVKKNVNLIRTSQNILMCKHPFNWDGIINNVTFDKRTERGFIEKIHEKLKVFGVKNFSHQ